MPPVDVKATAAALKALPFIGDVAWDALLEQLKEKASKDGVVTHDVLHEACKAMGVDKEVEEPAKEAEEGDAKEEDAAPPAPPKFTDNAADLFAVLDVNKKGAVSAADLLSILQLCTVGWGEGTLKNVLSAHDLAGRGGLSEADLWAALGWAAPAELGPQHRVHLRKAWRTTERWAPEEKGDEDEAGEEDAEDGGAAAAEESKDGGANAEPEPTRVAIDDFVEKLREDEYLAAALLQDVPVPEDPAPDAEGDDDEE